MHDLVSLYDLKNAKNTNVGLVLLFVKLQASVSSMGAFHVFYIVQMVPYRATRHKYPRRNGTRICRDYTSKYTLALLGSNNA